jgi:hypothetical protein
MYPHRIHLRKPWDVEPLDAGRARLRRRFGRPTNLGPEEHVWLTYEDAPAGASLWLNGTLIGRRDGPAGPFEFDVTEQLRERNEVWVEFESKPGELWGAVALEVRCAAFLRDAGFAFAEGGRGSAVGAVVGPAGLALELYVIVNRRTVAYSCVEASPEGRPFQLVFDPPEGAFELQIDLVHVASVWYRSVTSMMVRAEALGGE